MNDECKCFIHHSAFIIALAAMTLTEFSVKRSSPERNTIRPSARPTIARPNVRRKGRGELPLLVVADRQTAGRGRGANRWWTGPGALAFSLLVDGRTVGADRSRSPLVALAAAVAVVDTVAPLLPAHQVGIHWPNDVLVAERKAGRHSRRGAARPAARRRHRPEHEQHAGRRPRGTAAHGRHAPRPLRDGSSIRRRFSSTC